jgi:tetratricopeptide (TPR) repeat protein
MTELGYREVAAHWRRASVWIRRAFVPMAQVLLVGAVLELSYGTNTARWTTATVATPAMGFVLLAVAVPFVVLWFVALVRSSSAHNETAHVAQVFAGPNGKELAAVEDAVASYRRLATADAAYEPTLGGSLNDLSVRLAQVGQRGDALAASGEAVGMFRRLAAANASYLPGLAMSLNNLSADFCGVGRRHDALAAIEEAVAIRRHFAGADPAAHLPALAASLDNMSVLLADVGRHDDALAARQEAEGIRQR